MGPESGFTPPEVGLSAKKEDQAKTVEEISTTQSQIDQRRQELNSLDEQARALDAEQENQANSVQIVDKRASRELIDAQYEDHRRQELAARAQEQQEIAREAQPFKVVDKRSSAVETSSGIQAEEDTGSVEYNEGAEDSEKDEKSSPLEWRINTVFSRKSELSEELTGLKAKLNELRSQETADSAVIKDLESQKNVIELQKALAEKEVNKIKMSYLGKIGSVARQINLAEQQKQNVRDNLYNPKEGVWPLGELGKLDVKISQLKSELEERKSLYREGFKEQGDPRVQAQRELITGYEKNLQALQEGRASERLEEVKQEAEQMVLSASVTGPIVTSEPGINRQISPEDVAVTGMSAEVPSGEENNLQQTNAEEHDDNIEVQRGQELTLIEDAHDTETETQERGFRTRISEFLGRVRDKLSQNSRKIGKFALALGACAALLVGTKNIIDNYSADNIGPGHKVTNSAILEARENTPQFYVDNNDTGPETTPPPDGNSPDDGLKITPDNDPNSPDSSIDRTVTETGDQIETHNTSGDIPINGHLSSEPTGTETSPSQVEHSPIVDKIYDFADKEYGIPSNVVEQVLADNPSASQDLQNRIDTFRQDKDKNPGQTFDKGETDPVKAATTEWFESWFSGRI